MLGVILKGWASRALQKEGASLLREMSAYRGAQRGFFWKEAGSENPGSYGDFGL